MKEVHDISETQIIREELLRTAEVEADIFYPSDLQSETAIQYIASKIVLPIQTHSLNVSIVSGMESEFPNTDALITFRPLLRIGVRTADCVPILLYSPDIKGIAAVHAGWRGTLGGILAKTVDKLIEHGADPSRMIAIFGPSISKERYEVDHELASKFANAHFEAFLSYPEGIEKKPHLDLQGINIFLLKECGLSERNIQRNGNCTYSSLLPSGAPAYYSYRRNPGCSGRIISTIMLK